MDDASSGQSGQRVILNSHLLAAVCRLIWEALCSPGCVAPSLCSTALAVSLLRKAVQCLLLYFSGVATSSHAWSTSSIDHRELRVLETLS